MIASIQHTELLTCRQYRLQTNLAVFIIFFDIGLLLGTGSKISDIGAFWVQKLTNIAISAITLHEILADDLFLILVQKLLNHVIFILLKIPDELLPNLLAAYGFNNISLVVIFIKDQLFTLMPVVCLIIILENIRLVVSCATVLQVLLEII